MLKHNRVLVNLSVLTIGVIMLLAAPSIAQDAAAKPMTQDEVNKQLLDRISELESEVKELKGKPSSAAAPAASAPQPVAESAPPEEDLHKLQTIGFGDVGYQASQKDDRTNSFVVGSFDLFMSSPLSEKISAYSELVIVPNHLDNSVGLDLERIMLQYNRNRYFNVGIGRYHTDLGYYNTAFHHAQFLQTTLDRPQMYAFDDQDGFMPLQSIGVSANGEIPSGKLGLHWIAQAGNGRDYRAGSEPAQNVRDINNDKAFNLAMFARPQQFPGLQTGISFYRDVITVETPPLINQRILTAYAVYTNSKYEWLNEAALVSNAPVGERVFHTTGFYTQLSRLFSSKYRPYVRYSYLNSSLQDPLFAGEDGNALVSRQNDLSFGMRYDMNGYSAFKLQLDHYDERALGDWNRIAAQFAFTF